MDKVHSYAYQKKVFTKEECEKIINIAKNKSWSRGKIRSVKKCLDYEKQDMRSSNICWISCDEETDWIFSKIIYSAFKLNADFFQFNISGMDEGLQFTNYKSPSDRYDKHVDRCYNAKVRKLSLSIQDLVTKRQEKYKQDREAQIKLDKTGFDAAGAIEKPEEKLRKLSSEPR